MPLPMPPLKHSLPRPPPAIRASRANRGEEDQVADIFRGIRKSHASEAPSHQWPKVLLSKLSSDPEISIEERRELPPGEQLPILVRSNPVVQAVHSDDLSVKSDITTCVSLKPHQPYFVIQFNKDGKAQVLEQPSAAPSTPLTSNRKRLRSKDVVPAPKQIKKAVQVNKGVDMKKDTKWQVSAISHLERFAELIEALTPSMCGASANTKATNLGTMTPWHSHSSIDMHYAPQRYQSDKPVVAMYHKSYMTTTLSSCRAF